MKYSIEYTLRATKHITESYLWIKNQAPISADKWRIDLINKVESLSENPKRCPLAPESKKHKTEIRHLLFGRKRGQYRILFTISKKKIVILDIRHSFRAWLETQPLDTA